MSFNKLKILLKDKTISDKIHLIDIIVEKMQNELIAIENSAKNAHSGATHEDAIAKSKYDTHGLELSYLAGSQYERAQHLHGELIKMKALKKELKVDNDSIKVGSIIEVISENDNHELYFLSPYGAGYILEWNGHKVKMVSTESPLGIELHESFVGDEIELGNKNIKEIIACL